jgi:hypothetical protein
MPIDSFFGSIYPLSILLIIVYEIVVKIGSIFCPVFAEHSIKDMPFLLAQLKPSSYDTTLLNK